MAVISLGYGQKQVMFQEFSTKERCAAAMTELSKIGSDIEKIVCLPK